MVKLMSIPGDKNEYLFMTKKANACWVVLCNCWNGVSASSDVARLSSLLPQTPDLLSLMNLENSSLVFGITQPTSNSFNERDQ